MKILALNSSPRGTDQSKTEMLLAALVEGLRSANAEVEVVHLRKKKIRDCLGCYSCWTKTPGKCAQKDDMSEELYPKFLEADIAVYATPLYYYGVNAQLKRFIERTLPALEPFLIERDGHGAHPLRGRHPVIVALSVAGFIEDSVFDPMSSQLRRIYKGALIAEIYRPASEWLVREDHEAACNDVLSALKQAGEEIAKNYKVSDGTMKRIKQPIIDIKPFCAQTETYWKACIDASLTPKEAIEKGIVKMRAAGRHLTF